MNKIFLVYVFIFTIFNFEAKSETSKKLTCSAYEKFIIETEKVAPYDEEINLELLFQVDHEVGDGKGVILLNTDATKQRVGFDSYDNSINVSMELSIYGK